MFLDRTYSAVNLTGGALPDNVFWDAVSSVTLDTGANMVGNFLASTSITMGANVTLCGWALANTGDVTMISDTLSCNGSTIVDNAAYSSTGALRDRSRRYLSRAPSKFCSPGWFCLVS